MHLSSVTIAQTIRTAAERLTGAGISQEEAALEARLLYQHASVSNAEHVIAAMHREAVSAEIARQMERLVERRCRREPLAHITGQQEFYGRRFKCDRRALIPRPETELLVDLTLDFIKRNNVNAPQIIDIATGSGILAITLALEITDAVITSTDISDDALQLAIENTRQHNISPHRIKFMNQDARTSPIASMKHRFHVVVSNPPYLKTSQLDGGLQPEVSRWEPRVSLDGGGNGIGVLKPIILSLPEIMRLGESCAAFIEIDPPVAEQCRVIAEKTMPKACVTVGVDYAGLERVLTIHKS